MLLFIEMTLKDKRKVDHMSYFDELTIDVAALSFSTGFFFFVRFFCRHLSINHFFSRFAQNIKHEHVTDNALEC